MGISYETSEFTLEEITGSSTDTDRGVSEENSENNDTLIVPDIHGDPEPLYRSLNRFGLIDRRRNWIGEKVNVVLCGDLIDRGGKDKETLDALISLKNQVLENGGSFNGVVGNHDWFLLNALYARQRLDLMYFLKYCGGIIKDFEIDNVALFDGFHVNPENLELGIVRRTFLKESNHVYTRFFHTLNLLHKFDDKLVVHGGLNLLWANFLRELGIEGVNDKFWNDIKEGTSKSEYFKIAGSRRDGPNSNEEVSPIWFDHFALKELSESDQIGIYRILKDMGVNYVFSGHNVGEIPRSITWSFDERGPLRFICLDTGMVPYYSGGNGAMGGAYVNNETNKIIAIDREGFEYNVDDLSYTFSIGK